ncbi:hypothetical protein J5N97_009681 [Dioscorea zingiberensis]|uniref:adenine phosphoribosyltransferase n=1 Tax=Dioscorea zingiberensis TaxID=325984 RepID=A0A9D5CXB3_9LILI|nr:hypothetical protein J5N97_009681 [Dioscorea zingiberensis]
MEGSLIFVCDPRRITKKFWRHIANHGLLVVLIELQLEDQSVYYWPFITFLLAKATSSGHVLEFLKYGVVESIELLKRGSCTGVETRGFIFGAPIALAIGAKFIPLRKPRKLPGEVISEKYDLEYGIARLFARVEMHVGAVQPEDRALVGDDLIATGGTHCATINLLERAGAEVFECVCVIKLPEPKV